MMGPLRRPKMDHPLHPESILTYNERVLLWPQPCSPGRYQFVVCKVILHSNQHFDRLRWIFICQNGVTGNNFVWKVAQIRTPAARNENGIKQTTRTQLDQVLESMFGALPPPDFDLLDCVGVNFYGRCKWNVSVDRHEPTGYRRRALILHDSIEPFDGPKKQRIIPIIPED